MKSASAFLKKIIKKGLALRSSLGELVGKSFKCLEGDLFNNHKRDFHSLMSL